MKLKLSILAVALALAGCGGGSSDTSSSSDIPMTPIAPSEPIEVDPCLSVIVNGEVLDIVTGEDETGLIVIKGYYLDGELVPHNECGIAITDGSSGNYELKTTMKHGAVFAYDNEPSIVRRSYMYNVVYHAIVNEVDGVLMYVDVPENLKHSSYLYTIEGEYRGEVTSDDIGNAIPKWVNGGYNLNALGSNLLYYPDFNTLLKKHSGNSCEYTTRIEGEKADVYVDQNCADEKSNDYQFITLGHGYGRDYYGEEVVTEGGQYKMVHTHCSDDGTATLYGVLVESEPWTPIEPSEPVMTEELCNNEGRDWISDIKNPNGTKYCATLDTTVVRPASRSTEASCRNDQHYAAWGFGYIEIPMHGKVYSCFQLGEVDMGGLGWYSVEDIESKYTVTHRYTEEF